MGDRTSTWVVRILAEAERLGFDLVGIGPASTPATAGRYREWLESGYQGEMAYLSRKDAITRRADLSRILPSIRTTVTVGANYHTQPLPPDLRDDPARGIMASYAWGDDYHEVMTPRLHRLAEFVARQVGDGVAYRAYVDTGPVLERDLAARNGIGFVGKNTSLIHPHLGSWFLLGELLLAADLGLEGVIRNRSYPPAKGTCGQCTRCLAACPTHAFPGPRILDARRCISYLTIELKGPIPRDLRPSVGNRIFGCDICQEVCPWNRRFARSTADPAFQPRREGIAPRLLELMILDDAGFRQRFRDSPVTRAKRRGLLRNVAVALGNWGNAAATPVLVRALRDPEPMIRGHAAWALGRIGGQPARESLANLLGSEPDEWVRQEVLLALQDEAQA